ncbi:hypothetical protein [Bdellovibrio sp. HCB209]|uniref:hypothetical protein n=1 Tax=Bdellovibrio sp. HCB209 TaxID=3394354 RepID=UPI0039B4B136
MKLLNLIPLVFLTLTACYDPADISYTPPEFPDKPVFQDFTYEGSSSSVNFKIIAADPDAPKLPAHVSVNIERKSPYAENLVVAALDSIYERMLTVRDNDQTITFGCDGTDQVVELASSIRAQEVILCGNLLVPQNFEIHATRLALSDANLTTEIKENDESPNMVSFWALEVILMGENSLTLKGKQDGDSISMAPSAFFTVGDVIGFGYLDIFSAKSVRKYQVLN